ncbi:MAG TPA: hypothetical protein VM537_25610 [Anaerolineae bacterium]|jgi:hypothetical protein|nr:hypothetical protein [Anaerolineae bacterium]
MDTFCVHCDERLDLGAHPRIGQRVVCGRCNARLEVISLSPAEIDWAYEPPAWDDRRAVDATAGWDHRR